MTLKDFINQAMDIATEALRAGNHTAYRQCMEIIANAIYEDLQAKEDARIQEDIINA